MTAWIPFARLGCLTLVSLMAAGLAGAPQRAWAQHADEARVSELVAPAPQPATERRGLSPALFWVGASATILSASVGSFYALEVRDLYDQAQTLVPEVSPERARIHDEMRSAEIIADALFVTSLISAASTIVLAFFIDWSGADGAKPAADRAAVRPQRFELAPLVLPGQQALVLRGPLP